MVDERAVRLRPEVNRLRDLAIRGNAIQWRRRMTDNIRAQ